MALALSPLRSSSGATLRTSAGGPVLRGFLPLPAQAPIPPDPTTGKLAGPMALKSASGTPLRTSSGALLFAGFLPLPGVVPIPPDPTTGTLPMPAGLKTSYGVMLRTASGAPVFRSVIPFPPRAFVISGITKNSSGVALPSCSVALYRTAGDVFIDRVTSDGSGAYSFSTAGPSEAYYVVAYEAGSPDVAGTSVNTLTGT